MLREVISAAEQRKLLTSNASPLVVCTRLLGRLAEGQLPFTLLSLSGESCSWIDRGHIMQRGLGNVADLLVTRPSRRNSLHQLPCPTATFNVLHTETRAHSQALTKPAKYPDDEACITR
jgi:hypothetical protein